MWRDFNYYIDQGDRYYNNNDFKSSIDEYSKAIRKEPKNILGYVRRGTAYDRLKLYNEAISDYTIALTVPPMIRIAGKLYNLHTSAYNARANSLINLERYEEAEADCYASQEIDPLFTLSHLTLGKIYQVYGKYKEAIKCYKKVITLEPDNELGYWHRGDLYKKLGQYEKAIEDYKIVIELDPECEFMKEDIAECLDLMVNEDDNNGDNF